MNNKFFLACILPLASCAQINNGKLQVLITNDYTLPVTISHLDDKNKEVKVVVNADDTALYKITPEQFLHLKPRFFELDGRVYQVKFSLPSSDTYKIEVWDAIKKPQGITLHSKTHSLQINRSQTLHIHINKKGTLSLGVIEKKKLA